MNSQSTYYSQADEKNRQKFRDWLAGLLKTEEVDLTFTKKDGTIREMKCTLIEDLLPQIEKKTDRVKKESNDVIAVFDLDKNAWRSVRYDSITQINFSFGEVDGN